VSISISTRAKKGLLGMYWSVYSVTGN